MKITRRYFFTLVAYATGGLLVYGSKGHAADKIPDGYALPTADEPIPKAMKYIDDAKKADATIRTDKKALCNGCSQYGLTHKEFKHPKDGKVATCEIFVKADSKLYVKSGGWCLGFQKKT